MTQIYRALLLCALITMFSCSSSSPESRSDKIQVLLVSTYHFINQGLDEINTDTDDYLTPERQGQINELVEKLSAFNPTKVLIEQNPETQNMHDSLYALFKNNQLNLTEMKNGQNEIFQLGFKIAKNNDLERVNCVDADGLYLGRYVNLVADSTNVEDYNDYKRQNNQLSEEQNEFILNNTILDNFRKINSQDAILRPHHTFNNHQIRIQDTTNILESPFKQDIVKIDGQEYFMRSLDGENIGIENYVEWFKRNAKIYKNMLDIAKQNDRIVVLFGTSHIRPLQLFLQDNPDFEIVETLNYLQ